MSAKGNTSRTEGFSNMRNEEVAIIKKLFEIAYLVAKDELPLSKVGILVNNERRHGVGNGFHAYANDKKGAEFVNFIGKSMVADLKREIEKCNLFSVLIDGTTDTACKDKEAVYILHFNPSPKGKDCVEVSVKFLRLKTVTKTEHRHVFDDAIEESLHSVLDSLDEQSYSRNNSLSSVIGAIEDQLKKKDIKCKDPFCKLVGGKCQNCVLHTDSSWESLMNSKIRNLKKLMKFC